MSLLRAVSCGFVDKISLPLPQTCVGGLRTTTDDSAEPRARCGSPLLDYHQVPRRERDCLILPDGLAREQVCAVGVRVCEGLVLSRIVQVVVHALPRVVHAV